MFSSVQTDVRNCYNLLPNIGNYTQITKVMKTTSVALGSYFENYIATTIETGRL